MTAPFFCIHFCLFYIIFIDYDEEYSFYTNLIQDNNYKTILEIDTLTTSY